MSKRIAVLGSTGSVGRSTLDVIRGFPGEFSVYALSCRHNTDLLLGQIEEFRPEAVAVLDPVKAKYLAKRLSRSKSRARVYPGAEGLARIACARWVDTVVGALAGVESLAAILSAIRGKKEIALANKELIVGFGEIIMAEARKSGVRILPLDSELSAIFQCMQGKDAGEIERVILTASGGPFYKLSSNKLKNITVSDALRHPVWKMGKKITVDSATLMNKGLEVIETSRFFGIPQEKIDVLIHPGSAVHSIVRFVDGTSLAQIAYPDMRIPIQFALSFPHRLKTRYRVLELSNWGKLEFIRPDFKKFPCLAYARSALKEGGCMPAVLNAGDEEAVEAFLSGMIGFTDIPKVIKKVMDNYLRTTHDARRTTMLKRLLQANRWAREEARRVIETGFKSRL